MLADLRARDVFCRAVQVDVASHSPQVEPLRDELRRRLATIAPRGAAVPMYSTVTGETIAGEKLDAEYWANNLRRPVLFSRATQNLLAAGQSLFVEMSPHPILLPAVEETLAETNAAGHVVASLRRDEDEQLTLCSALGQVYAAGRHVDWHRVYPTGQVVPLPAYPWQHQRYWLDLAVPQVAASRGRREAHLLLGTRLDLAQDDEHTVWEVELDERTQPYLAVHRLHDAPVVAAATYIELARLAAGRLGAHTGYALTDVGFERALVLPPDKSTRLQIVATRQAGGRMALAILSAQGDSWQAHFRCTVRPDASEPAAPAPVDWQAPGLERIAGDEFYQDLAARGAQFAESLRTILQVARGDRQAMAEMAGVAPEESFQVPAQLDAAFQLLGALAAYRLDMPVHAERICFHPPPQGKVWAHAQERGGRVDVRLWDTAGRVWIEIDGLELRSPEQAPDDLFQVRWQDCRRPDGAPREPARGDWLVIAEGASTGAALVASLQAQGAQAHVVRRTSDWHAHLSSTAWRGIVYLAGPETPGEQNTAVPAGMPEPVLEDAVRLVQDLARIEWREPPRVWFVTHGAQAVAPGDRPDIAQSALWGLARVIAVEHREFWGGLIDLDPAVEPAQAAERLCMEITQPDGEDEVAIRGDRRFIPRLVPFDGGREPFARWRPDAAYLITGGLGGIGAEVAQEMARQGARHLVLLGRTPPAPRESWAQLTDERQTRFAHTIRAIEALGASVEYAAVDVADQELLAAWVESYRRQGRPPIRGILHAAGVIDDRLIVDLDATSLHTVLRPKVAGALALQRVWEHADLDFFVLFSSAGALMGQAGQGSYAAANAALDALAQARRARGQAALSINWGAWTGLGFAATMGGRRVIEEVEAHGLVSMSARQGVQMLHRLLAADAAQVAVMPMQRAKLRATSRLFADLASGATAVASPRALSAPSPMTALRDELAALDLVQRRVRLEAYVQTTLGQVLRLAPGQIEPHTPLGTYGIESLSAIEFRNRLEAGLGLRLSATIVWNHPTVADLAVFLDGRLGALGQAPQVQALPLAVPPVAAPAPREHPQGDRVAARVSAMSDAEAMQELRKRKKGQG